MNILILLGSVIGGVLLSAQSSINGAFSKKSGTYEAAFLTFFSGALFLAIMILFFGEGNILKIFDAPKWQLAAVWFGVGYLFLTVLAVPRIGVIATNITTVIGQLTAGMVIDHFGFFGGLSVPFTVERLIAIIFMLTALYFIYVGNKKQKMKIETPQAS